MVDGNQRFVDRKLTFYQEDLAILQQNTAEKQEPFASVLSCADSRVSVELIFDQSIRPRVRQSRCRKHRVAAFYDVEGGKVTLRT